eukprot:SAG22_NODE_7134_length_772_cov_1.309064_1_plen_166_part_10
MLPVSGRMPLPSGSGGGAVSLRLAGPIFGGCVILCLITRCAPSVRKRVNYLLCWLLGCAIGSPSAYALDLTHGRRYKKIQANGKARLCLWALPYADRTGKPPPSGYPMVVLFHGTALTSTGCARIALGACRLAALYMYLARTLKAGLGCAVLRVGKQSTLDRWGLF